MVSRPQPISEQDLRDLGFGSVVSRESHQRLLNRDGSFNVRRKGLGLLGTWSPYHSLLTMPWPRFLLLGIFVYIVTNAIFAVLYLACGVDSLVTTSPGMGPHPFWRGFFFSVETLSTIGYGNIVPVTLGANVMVTIEALAGLMGFAIATGLVFARFSRPTANILFSSHAVIAPYQGMNALEFRVANGRSNELIEVTAKVVLSRFEEVDGVHTRRYYPLPLERDGVVFLPLTWTVVHPIDEHSALRGETPQSLRESSAEVLVLLKAFDETFSTIVQTRTSFTYDDVVWGARFANAFMAHAAQHVTAGPSKGGKVAVDMRLFDIIEPVLDRLNS
ncbi:MAG TPA: ion channel [Terriglobales bacterium]|jgi:inward rectifier potassium channel|nr:ion channel [Terriglobales bacterium]